MTLKKMLAICLALVLLLGALTGCGSKNSSDKPASKPESSESGKTQSEAEPEPEPESEPEPEPEPEEDPVPVAGSVPYNWLGLQDMPSCPYLDQLATNHYIQVYDTYVLGIQAEVTEAIDGINAYQKNQSNLTYSVDGTLFSINEDAKSYMQYEMTTTVENAKQELAKAMSEGINAKARVYQGTGKEAIPLYSEKSGDSAEYEYYEYQTGSADSGSIVIERYYMKDGDVYAIYTKTQVGESELESTNVIKSMSGDIPEGTFTVPDLSNYEKLN